VQRARSEALRGTNNTELKLWISFGELLELGGEWTLVASWDSYQLRSIGSLERDDSEDINKKMRRGVHLSRMTNKEMDLNPVDNLNDTTTSKHNFAFLLILLFADRSMTRQLTQNRFRRLLIN
jgi:hypothetical protein